ncbi:hypothetical protein HYT05_00845 [Candidatus Kaiserbacteria bacterium]|nr:hypothetical protein [Candidatus Kaiserbacteria bacterium]
MEQQNIIQEVYDKLAALTEANDYTGARALLKDRFTQLPEDVQGRLLTILLAEAIEMEAVALDGALAIQDEGITALKALEEMKAALQR